MSSSCTDVKTDFILCILRSPCYLSHPASSDPAKSNEALQHCLHHPEELPETCQHQRTALFECKKAMVCFDPAPGALPQREEPERSADERMASPFLSISAGRQQTVQRQPVFAG